VEFKTACATAPVPPPPEIVIFGGTIQFAPLLETAIAVITPPGRVTAPATGAGYDAPVAKTCPDPFVNSFGPALAVVVPSPN
jgi:hypothetical protein